MNDRIIEFDPLIEGVLIKRYKRFLADIKGFFSVLSVLAFNPANLYWFTTAINLKRNF